MDAKERQKFVEENEATIKRSNLNLITIFLAVIELIIVFYGPFVSIRLSEMKSSISIYSSLVSFIKIHSSYVWFGWILLIGAILIPVAIIILSLFKQKWAKRTTFILSLIYTLVLVIVTIKWMTGTGQALKIAQEIFSTTQKSVNRLVGITMGIGISSYLLLLTSVITNVTTYFNLKK